MPADPRRCQPWNTARFSATAIRCAARRAASRSTSAAPRSASRSSAREIANGARSSTSASTRRWRRVDALDRRRRRASRTRPRLVAECSQPCGSGEVDEPPRGERRRSGARAPPRRAAPARLGDRGVGAQQMVHRHALLCRLPMPSEPSPLRRARPRPSPRLLDGLRLGRLAVLDDVALLEEDPLRRSRATAGVRRRRNSRSMLKCLNSSPRASRMTARASRVGLDREALLVPADRFGLLGQRGAQASEGPRLRPAAPRAARGTGRSPHRHRGTPVLWRCPPAAARSHAAGARARDHPPAGELARGRRGSRLCGARPAG